MLPPPRFETIKEKKLLGMRRAMSFADNTTFELWSSFMPRRHEITNAIGTELVSMQVYPPGFWRNVDIHAPFDKWAACEVSASDTVPAGMEAYTIPKGLYAVFFYKGHPANAREVFTYILGQWLPSSGYILDERPHFEILGEKYNHNSPDSEEEIWIPVKSV